MILHGGLADAQDRSEGRGWGRGGGCIGCRDTTAKRRESVESVAGTRPLEVQEIVADLEALVEVRAQSLMKQRAKQEASTVDSLFLGLISLELVCRQQQP